MQIGHVQYISTIVKDDRKFFRKKFGVQFLLDVIRRHYGAAANSDSSALSREDAKTMRASLFGLVRFYLTRDVTWREVYPVVGFLQCCGDRSDPVVVRELCEVVTQYLEGRHARDQMFLIMYESRRADLLYPLLLDQGLSGGHLPQLRAIRLAVLRLLTTLLRSNKVSMRHSKCLTNLIDDCAARVSY